MVSKTEYMREYRAANRDKLLAQGRAYYKANAEEFRRKALPRAKKWLEENREKAKRRCADWYSTNKGRALNHQRTKRLENPERTKERRRKDYEVNAERYKSRAKAWRESKPAHARALSKKWKSANRGAVYAAVVQRKAEKLQRTPSWADLAAIKRFYENCPEGHHVDHIVPLRGKMVCGFHVEYNLQYLPAKENLMKGNKLIDTSSAQVGLNFAER